MAELSRPHSLDLDRLEAELERFQNNVLDYEIVLRDRSEEVVRAVEALRVAREDYARAIGELRAFRDLLVQHA